MNVVIIGLGYVGLPLAQEAVRVGLNVTGYDVKQSTVDGLNAGRSHIDDLSDGDIETMVEGGFRATTDLAELAGDNAPDVTVICVPTPLSESDGPDLTAVKAATDSAAAILKPGALIVLESTTYPGTTDEIVRPMLEKATGLTAGIDFHLAFSPERIDPGNEVYGIRNTPKVVGGLTPACTDAAAAFYGTVCDTVVKAKTAREAEMAKLLENTYRHVNIALVNEMAIFCHELGVDLWNTIDCAATKPFGFQAFYPGPGVGGHCIPIDPNYLSYKVRAELKHPFRFVELAQEINSRMPGYVVDRAAELLNTDAKPLNGAKVLLLGVTYKKDIADQRESPARPIARKLLQRGAVLTYHDPYVDSWQVDGRDIPRAASPAAAADLTILLQAHSEYDLAGHRREGAPAVRHPWQDLRRVGLPAVKHPPGGDPDPRKEARGARRRLHGRASPGRRPDLLPRDPRPARRWPRRHLHRPARRAGATARSRSRSRFSERSVFTGSERQTAPVGDPRPGTLRPSRSRARSAGVGSAPCGPPRPRWRRRWPARICCSCTTRSCCWCCRRDGTARRPSGTCTRTPPPR